MKLSNHFWHIRSITAPSPYTVQIGVFFASQLHFYLSWHNEAKYAANIAYLLPSSILKWLHKNSPILIFKMFLTFYCCTITVVPIFPLLCAALPNPTSHIQSFPLLSFSRGALYMFLHDPSPSLPHYPPLWPLWSLPIFSLFSSLCFYFAFLVLLLIRFHL